MAEKLRRLMCAKSAALSSAPGSTAPETSVRTLRSRDSGDRARSRHSAEHAEQMPRDGVQAHTEAFQWDGERARL